MYPLRIGDDVDNPLSLLQRRRERERKKNEQYERQKQKTIH